MSLQRAGSGPLANVPECLDDGSRLVGIAGNGTPVYFDPDRQVLWDRTGPDGTTAHRDLEGESIADAIAALERSRGWTVLSEYGLDALSDE